jgi:hypothetical protein
VKESPLSRRERVRAVERKRVFPCRHLPRRSPKNSSDTFFDLTPFLTPFLTFFTRWLGFYIKRVLTRRTHTSRALLSRRRLLTLLRNRRMRANVRRANDQMNRFGRAAIYCTQAFLGYWAWFFFFAASFVSPMWSQPVIRSICIAVVGALLSTGLWGVLFRVSIARLAVSYSLMAIISAVWCAPGIDFSSSTIDFGFALALYMSALLGGWLSLKLFPKR